MTHSVSPHLSYEAFMLIWGLSVLVILAANVFWVVQLVDCSRRHFRDDKVKLMWLLIVALGQIFGALIYRIYGRNRGWRPAAKS